MTPDAPHTPEGPSYHNRCMNVPFSTTQTDPELVLAAQVGHRDARHQCADHAADADATIASLRADVAFWQDECVATQERRKEVEAERDSLRADVARLQQAWDSSLQQAMANGQKCHEAIRERDAARADVARLTAARQRADDWCASVMERLCRAAGVDWDSFDEPTIQDMEEAIREQIRDLTSDVARLENERAARICPAVYAEAVRDLRNQRDAARQRIVELEATLRKAAAAYDPTSPEIAHWIIRDALAATSDSQTDRHDAILETIDMEHDAWPDSQQEDTP